MVRVLHSEARGNNNSARLTLGRARLPVVEGDGRRCHEGRGKGREAPHPWSCSVAKKELSLSSAGKPVHFSTSPLEPPPAARPRHSRVASTRLTFLTD